MGQLLPSSIVAAVIALLCTLASCGSGDDSEPGLSFFVTSRGSGAAGGDLGGLAGADADCQSLATAVGAGNRRWRAYLSTKDEDARDRIGNGPWYNARLDLVADNLETLHRDGLHRAPFGATGIDALDTVVFDERGNLVPGREHDLITGSADDGTFLIGRTCDDWTSSSDNDVAQVGHSDIPTGFDPSWNSAHSTVGCSEDGLAARLGSGRFYCFAAD